MAGRVVIELRLGHVRRLAWRHYDALGVFGAALPLPKNNGVRGNGGRGWGGAPVMARTWRKVASALQERVPLLRSCLVPHHCDQPCEGRMQHAVPVALAHEVVDVRPLPRGGGPVRGRRWAAANASVFMAACGRVRRWVTCRGTWTRRVPFPRIHVWWSIRNRGGGGSHALLDGDAVEGGAEGLGCGPDPAAASQPLSLAPAPAE